MPKVPETQRAPATGVGSGVVDVEQKDRLALPAEEDEQAALMALMFSLTSSIDTLASAVDILDDVVDSAS